MSTTLPPPEAPAPEAPGPPLGVRTLRVFARPFQAWEGLETHVRWWFPLLVYVLVQAALFILTFHRVMLPMMRAGWDQAVANGQMTADRVDQVEKFFSSPGGVLAQTGAGVVFTAAFMFLVAVVVWFGVGFVLGRKFPFRLALEVVTWASLVRIPELLVTYAIGWSQETLKGVHLGLGVLLPDMDPPSKLHVGLGVLLDAFGPFVVWNLFVTVVGCSVLSGAPRKNVAWVLAVLYLALTAVFAVVAYLFAPGA